MSKKLSAALVAALVGSAVATAHFVYVVPAKDSAVQVVFSDDLTPDEAVSIEKVAGVKLQARVEGKDTKVETKTDKHSLSAALPKGATLVYGNITYGTHTREEKTSLLVYHPKLVLNGLTDKEATAGDKAAVELVPVADGGKVKFKFLVGGKPAAGADGSVLLPDGKKEKVKTDKDGFTAAFEAKGRYAVWVKNLETKAGEHDGKKYEQTTHYATLVADHK